MPRPMPSSISSVMRSDAATVLTPVASSTMAACFSGPCSSITIPRCMSTTSSGRTRSANSTASSVHMW